jgi:hypothetical protein
VVRASGVLTARTRAVRGTGLHRTHTPVAALLIAITFWSCACGNGSSGRDESRPTSTLNPGVASRPTVLPPEVTVQPLASLEDYRLRIEPDLANLINPLYEVVTTAGFAIHGEASAEDESKAIQACQKLLMDLPAAQGLLPAPTVAATDALRRCLTSWREAVRHVCSATGERRSSNSWTRVRISVTYRGEHVDPRPRRTEVWK